MKGEQQEPKKELTDAQRARYLQIKKRLDELMLEDAKLREELEKMGLKFERKWWHGALGKPKNFEA